MIREADGQHRPSRYGKVKYRAIRDALRREIESGVHGPGQRLPPDGDLASRFETSRLTVIRALRDLQSEGLVQRKAGSGTFVQTAPTTSARVFGLLVPDLGEGEVFEPICRGVARAGESFHQTLLWGDLATSSQKREDQAEELCRYFISRKVAGVFFAPLELSPRQDEVNHRIAENLDRARIPVVLLDRCFSKYPARSHYDLVAIDNRRAGYRMTEHLLQAGSRRIAYVYRPHSACTVEARYAGYREALWAAGIPALEPLVFECERGDSSAVKDYVGSVRPDGFMCANDLTAARLMHCLLKLGARIPEQVRLVGINDVKYARFLPVPLTTLRQPCSQIGAAAMATMLRRLENPTMPAQDVLLECEMVIRNSSVLTPMIPTDED